MSTVAKNSRSSQIVLSVSSAGPFSLGFRLFDVDTINVYVGGTLRTDYTLAALFVNGYDDAATITFNSPITAPATINIDASLVPWRQDDLGSQNLVSRLNIELGRVWSALAELRRDARRALRGFVEQEPATGLDAAAVMAAQGYSATAAASAAAAAASAAAAAAAQNTILKPKGQWLTATAYVLGDLVYQSGSQYECIQAHTSGTFATDLSAAKWRIFVAQGNTGAGTGDVLAANNGSEYLSNAGTFRSNLALMGALLTAETGADVHARAAANPRGMWFVAGSGMTNAPPGYAANEVFFAKGFDANNLTVSWFRSDGMTFIKTRVAGNWGAWVQHATLSDVTSAIAAAQQIFHVREEQSSGLNGGTFTAGSYLTRVLNTVKANSIPGASLSSNRITLPAGTYEIDASAPGFAVGSHKAILYNVSSAAVILVGSTEVSSNTYGTTSRSVIKGRFTLAGSQQVELRHRCQVTYSYYGQGLAASFGEAEVYAEAFIRKIS